MGTLFEHGGEVRKAAARYGIPVADWLDLSTGINPHGWPVPVLPAACWQRLPELDEALHETARRYYACDALLPVAGTQAAIQALPRLRTCCRVGVLRPTYSEHARAWARAGHAVRQLAAAELDDRMDDLDVVVVTNPNNPTGRRFAVDTLRAWRERLAARGGWLVVDEAFMDVTPADSLAADSRLPGLIVLRSLGKFFGLAGARLGFVLAEQTLLDSLADHLGPWAVSGPAAQVARRALADVRWQQAARAQLQSASQRLINLLTDVGLAPEGGTPLFQWVRTQAAPALHEGLARQGILVRLFQSDQGLRFGLPGDESQWRRLRAGLQQVTKEHDLIVSA